MFSLLSLIVLFAIAWFVLFIFLGGIGVESNGFWATVVAIACFAWLLLISVANAIDEGRRAKEEKARWTTCPHCWEKIVRGATVCAHCGRDV